MHTAYRSWHTHRTKLYTIQLDVHTGLVHVLEIHSHIRANREW